MSILEQLYALQDTGYADFQSGLVPNIPRERFIGVRMPNMRRLAKQMAKEDAAQAFMAAVPHTYYDENILHALSAISFPLRRFQKTNPTCSITSAAG